MTNGTVDLSTLLLRLQIFTVAVASSYLTLGAFSPRDARSLWWLYGLLTFVLAVTMILLERRRI